MDAEQLAARVLVRYREAGHLRLELPPELCHAATATVVEGDLRGLAGVYRVGFDADARRLSIRFDSHACSTGDVARRLKALLVRVAPLLPATDTAASAEAGAAAGRAADGEALAASAAGVGMRLRETIRRGAAHVHAALETLRSHDAAAGSLRGKLQPVVASALTEKAIMNFLNDLVAFYLIKAHWELITKRWLKDPVGHANAWAAVSYLVFLLVRFRKTAK